MKEQNLTECLLYLIIDSEKEVLGMTAMESTEV